MSGDTFGAEEIELRRAAERSAPYGGETADILAATCESQRRMLASCGEQITRAIAALESAGIHVVTAGREEEVGDGICRLAGERDQYRSLLHSIARGIGMQPDESSGYLRVVQCALHLAAKAGEQVRTLAAQDAQLRALENLVAEKSARIATLERSSAAAEAAIDGAMKRLGAR